MLVQENYNKASDTSEEIECLLDDIPYSGLSDADSDLLDRAVSYLEAAKEALAALLNRHQ